MFGQQAITVHILRPPAPSGGKIGTPIDTGMTAQVLIEPHGKYDPIVLEADGRQYYNLQGYVTQLPLADIREQDRLQDQAEIDAHTRQPALYIVRGTWRFPTSHLELFLQRQLGA